MALCCGVAQRPFSFSGSESVLYWRLPIHQTLLVDLSVQRGNGRLCWRMGIFFVSLPEHQQES